MRSLSRLIFRRLQWKGELHIQTPGANSEIEGTQKRISSFRNFVMLHPKLSVSPCRLFPEAFGGD